MVNKAPIQAPVFSSQQLEQALQAFDEVFIDSSFPYFYILDGETARDAYADYKGFGSGLQGQEIEVAIARREFDVTSTKRILEKLETGLYSSIHRSHMKIRVSKLTDEYLTIRLQSSLSPFSEGNLIPIKINLIEKSDPLFAYYQHPDFVYFGLVRETFYIPNPIQAYLLERFGKKS